MKTKKIITLILSLALLVGGIAVISASADNAEKSASVAVTTLNYGAETRIAYALRLEVGTSAEDVALKLYKTPDLSDTPSISAFSGEYYGEAYPVYYSMGISAKDIADAIYAVPCNAKTGVAIGEACRYSVAEYCHYNLNNNVSADLKQLSSDLLEYGASAQKRLINTGNLNADSEILIGDYTYINNEDVVTSDKNGFKTKLFAPDEQIFFSYNGEKVVKEWKLTYKDGTTLIIDASKENGIDANLVAIEPIFSVKVNDFEDGKISNTNIEQHDLLASPTLISGADAPLNSYDGTYIDYSVTNDPNNSSNKVLKAEMIKNSSKNARTIVNISSDTNSSDYVYEMKMYVSSPTAYGTSAYIYFDNASSQNIFYFYLKTTADGVTVYDNGVSKETIGTFAFDTWVDIRIEMHVSTELEENCVKFYMGEAGQPKTLVKDLNTYMTAGDNLSRMRIDYARGTSNTFYLDDIYFAVDE